MATNAKDKSTLKILDYLREQTPGGPSEEEEEEDLVPAPVPDEETDESALPLTRPPSRTKLFTR